MSWNIRRFRNVLEKRFLNILEDFAKQSTDSFREHCRYFLKILTGVGICETFLKVLDSSIIEIKQTILVHSRRFY